jgi:hypothetical protein
MRGMEGDRQERGIKKRGEERKGRERRGGKGEEGKGEEKKSQFPSHILSILTHSPKFVILFNLFSTKGRHTEG